MIALPMVALSFAVVSYDMFTLTPAEKAGRTMGQADARVRWEYPTAVEQGVEGDSGWPAHKNATKNGTTEVPGFSSEQRPTEADLLAKLPAGSRAYPLDTGLVSMRTAAGVGRLEAIAVDATTPRTNGFLKVLAGRAPAAAGEVALTKEASTRLAAGLGSTVNSADGTRAYTMVGLIEYPSSLDEWVLFSPAARGPGGPDLSDNSWLVESPTKLDWAAVRRLNESGVVVASRAVYLDPPPSDQIQTKPESSDSDAQAAVVIVTGLALLEVVLLAGPAFAVGARRRQRQLALVAANGGTPPHIRRIVLADGVVLGGVGAVVGVAAGIAVAFGIRPWTEELLVHSRAGGYRVFPLALAVIGALGVM
jgi:putative ABC transport system permease protein